MDWDSTRGKWSFDKIINSFANHEVDILIGTQMITKGLDFKNVNLVGVLNTDHFLNYTVLSVRSLCNLDLVNLFEKK